MTLPARPVPLPSLTGLRFLAAAVVVAYHFAPPPVFYGGDAGPAAVTLFFLLSGFILTYTAPPGPVPLRPFYVARLARVYPAYLLGLGLAIALLPAGVPHPSPWCPAPAHAILPALLLVQAWLPDMACLNGPAWSLSCEVFFYALFPLLLPLVRRVPQPRLGQALAACWVVGLALPEGFLVLKHAQMTTGLSGALVLVMNVVFRHTSPLPSSPLARVPDFVCGMLLGRLYLSGVRVRHPHSALALACAWTCVVLLGGIGLHGPVDEALCWPAFALVLLVLAQGTSAPACLLSRPTIVLLGEASYGLYILHWPLHDVMQLARLASPPPGDWPASAAYSMLALASALLSLVLLETPLRRAIRAALAPPATTIMAPTDILDQRG